MINQNEGDEEKDVDENINKPEDVDEDALAYIQAKKRVQQLQRARKNERRWFDSIIWYIDCRIVYDIWLYADIN